MEHVFITGCPRSGTTMLASMLGASEGSITTPESDFIVDFVLDRLDEERESIDLDGLQEFLKNNYRFRQWDIGIDTLNIEKDKISLDGFRGLVEELVLAYEKKHRGSSRQATKRIDHTPSTILYYRLIKKIFPESKMVFIVRDPRAVYASVKNLDWGANTALKLSEIWIEYCSLFYAVRELDPNNIYLTTYENLVTNPEKEVKRICTYTNLKYNQDLLEGKGFIVPKYTTSQHELVGKKPSTKAMDKWKSELTKNETQIIEAKCGVLMESFGYSCIMPVNHKINYKDHAFSLSKEFSAYFVNKLKKSKRKKL